MLAVQLNRDLYGGTGILKNFKKKLFVFIVILYRQHSVE